MTLELFVEKIKSHGIRETTFSYRGNVYWLIEEFDPYGIGLSFSLGSENKEWAKYFEKYSYVYEDIDKLIVDTIFDGLSMREIWNEVELISLDGVCEKDYIESCSFNFAKAVKDFGEIQGRFYSSSKKVFLLQLAYAVLGVLLFTALSSLLLIFGVTNWYVILIAFGCAALVSLIVLLKSRRIFNYIITDKKIIVWKWRKAETTYDNIKEVKLKRKKNTGTIKIYVKKGLSLNYHIVGVPNPKEICDLILKNINQ